MTISHYWLVKMEAYICRGSFKDNFKYDWLMMMSLGGAVVSIYRVTI